MTEQALDKKAILAELTKSAHGDLAAYLPVGLRAAAEDPDFFAHLVAWNHLHGSIKDAQIALPVIALAAMKADERAGVVDEHQALTSGYADNALAHLADLTPQMLKRVFLPTTRLIASGVTQGKTTTIKKTAVTVPPFAVTAGAPKRLLRRLVTRYLRDLEADRGKFEYVAVQHRQTLHELYTRYHVSCPSWVSQILFKRVKGQPKDPITFGIIGAIRRLHLMGPEEAAGTIVKFKIPFLIARGALGAKAKDPDTVLALIKAMSPTELVTNVKWLDKLGVKTNPALRAAFEAAIGRAAAKPATKSALKTTRAAEALADDTALSGKLRTLQEKQIDKLGGIDGNWLVLGDKSGSMAASIDGARDIAAVLARMVKGQVHLVFFDSTPRYFDVTGKSFEDIKKITSGIVSGGGTAMDCGIRYALDKGLSVDGIVFVGDGANHGPAVIPTYRKYCDRFGTEPTLYFYQMQGEPDTFSGECRRDGVDLQTFDLRGKTVDYYSVPNLVQTMRVARFSLLDDVLQTPLRSLDDVLDRTKGMTVVPKGQPVSA